MARTDELRRIEQAIMQISRIGTGRAAARVRSERSGVQVSRPGIALLAALNTAGPLRPTDLAERTDLELPLVSREVRVLAAEGYVQRSPHPADGRVSIVELTAKGRRAYRAYRAATDEIIAESFSGWSADDLTALAAMLERVVADAATAPTSRFSGKPAGRPVPRSASA
jgi:DNA-binding MarR family transcriptional regulator